MYTQCPECDTIFRVNAALLRAAHGQVRCGVCDATFDAIRFLTDEIESGVNAESASHIHYEPQAADSGKVPAELDDTVGSDGAQSPIAPPQAGSSLPLVAFEVADAANEWWATPVDVWPTEVLETPDSTPLTPDPAPASSMDAPVHADDGDSHHADTPLAVGAIETEAEASDNWMRMSALDSPAEPSISVEEDDRVTHRRRRARGGRWGTGLACAILSVGLLAQWVDHERNTLATDPRFAEILTPLYAALGRSLDPRWDVAAYDIRDWTASPDPATNTIRLKARIRNRAERAQPWPLLRVVFEDRYGTLVARRDFKPSEYLSGHPPQSALMGRGTLIEADLSLADPGAQVVSYEIDACLAHGNDVGCGADAKSSPGQ